MRKQVQPRRGKKTRWICHGCKAPLNRKHDCERELKKHGKIIPKFTDRGLVYCQACWSPGAPKPLPDHSFKHNNNPWGDNATRALEG